MSDNQDTIQWGGNIQTRSKTIPQEAVHTNNNPSPLKNTIVFRHNALPGKILSMKCRGMWTIKKTGTTKMLMDMNNTYKTVLQGQKHKQEGWTHGILQ